MTVTVDDVENTGNFQGLSREDKQHWLDMAERMLDGPLSTRQTNFPTLIGDKDDALELLTAHLWTLHEGGEAQSESQTGGSVSYNTVTGDAINSLQQTRYGRTLSDMYLRDRQGLGIQRR